VDRALLLANLGFVGIALAGLLALLTALHLLERATGRYLAHRLGWRAVLATGWLGVPLHELAHLCAAAFFRHRIIAWSLFDPDPVTGTLGYVRHAYRRRSAWQVLGTFVIGIAPVLAGAVAIAALLAWVLPPTDRGEILLRVAALPGRAEHGLPELTSALASLTGELLARVWQARTLLLPLQLYLLLCVTSHLAPSRADLLGALPGGLLASLLAAGGVLLASLLGTSLVGLPFLLAPLLGLLLLTGLCQLLYVGVVALLGVLERAASGPRTRSATR
jgi:hypothetical protein